MAEKSMLWATGTSGDGTAAYTEAETTRLFKSLVGNDPATEGVLFAVDGNLAVTGTASPLAVNSGAAFVNGYFYWNTASVNVVVTTPVIGTTGGRVVLQMITANKTVRIALIMSSDGVPGYPALTQTDNVKWEISLADFTITTGGVITLTDARGWIHMPTKVSNSMIDDLSVGTAKLANDSVDNTKIRNSAGLSVIGRSANSTGDPADIAAGADDEVLRRSGVVLGFGQVATGGITDLAVTSGKLASNAVTNAKVADNAINTAEIVDAAVTEPKIAGGAVTATKIGTGAVTTAKIAGGAVTDTELGNLSVGTAKIIASAVTTAKIDDLAVTTAKIQDDAVDDTKAGNRVPQFYRRAGGSASDWSSPGNSVFTPGAVRMQAGAVSAGTVNAGGTATGTVNFPVAFSNPPLIFCFLNISDGSGAAMVIRITFVSATVVNFTVENIDSVNGIAIVNWFAVGPE